ncbi:hypothetical protein [Edaphobacter aggregans]|uniref:hypothetical protein n=1 Tax=Edaphobacter aggregans TaxID=570835 RepID=UPI000558C284|nr:hypothetical protein [Edaphobacter aggregans]
MAIPLAIALSLTTARGQDFPKSSLDLKGSLKSQWYSSQLRALEEPSLYSLSKSTSAESYRFLWLRTFHHPIAIRLDPNPDGTSTVIVKVASGAAGFRPGVLSEQRSQLVSKEQTQAFLKRVSELRFWDASNPVNDQRGTDGSQWIIEGVRAGRYHVVDRWTPTKGVVRELGMILAFDLAKMDIPKDEIY